MEDLEEFESTGSDRLDNLIKYQQEGEQAQEAAPQEDVEEENEFDHVARGLTDSDAEEFLNQKFQDDGETVRNLRYAYGDRGVRRAASQGFTAEIVQNESGGDYSAVNPHSSATGKYQFLWSKWGNAISKFTGVKSRQDFLNNPQAQDKFYEEYYLPNELVPAVKRLQSRGVKKDFGTLAKLVHFRGEKGAMDWLSGRASDRPESYNMPTSSYIKQSGGYNELEPIYAGTGFDYEPTLSLNNKIPYSYGDNTAIPNAVSNYYANKTSVGASAIPTTGQGINTDKKLNITTPEKEALDALDGRLTAGLNVVDKGINFVQNVKGIAGSAVSNAGSALDMFLSKRTQRENDYDTLMKLNREKPGSYSSKPDFQNLTKNI